MAAGALGRLLEMFEGPEAPGPWTPPAIPAALHALLPWRAWDESSELYVNAASTGFVLELPPFAGIDAETLGALSGTLADAAPERCTIQIVHWASPRFGAAFRAWAEPRVGSGAHGDGALARMGSRRRDLLAPGGWRRLHEGGPPFTLSDYREECFAMLAGVIGRMARRRGSIDDIEAALIAEAIAAAWDEAGNEADLGTVRGHLAKRDDRRAADMATSLGPWCPGGAMGRLFAGSNVPDLENAMTVFELAELKGRGDVQAVVLMLVVFLATQRMYHGPRTRAKAIVIDEAWDLLSGEDSRAFLEGAARRARKYRGALITGTQSVNDYYANPAARAAWENSDWVIFLAQKDESVELLKSEKRIHCDPGMERALKSLTTADGRYAELVLHGPDGWRVARLVLDAWSVALFSSRGPAFAAVETLKAEGLSTVEAIDRLAGDGPLAGDAAPAATGHSETTEPKGGTE